MRIPEAGVRRKRMSESWRLVSIAVGSSAEIYISCRADDMIKYHLIMQVQYLKYEMRID